MRQLTASDAQFLDIEDARNLGHVAFLAVLDPSTAPSGRLEVEDMCRVVGRRLDRLPPFRWKLASVPLRVARPYWVVDPDFDLDFHIRELALPPGGGERELAEQVARIASRPLDRSRPLWELYVIHGLPAGRVAVLTKMHHAAIDGVSGIEVMGVLFDERPAGRDEPSARNGVSDTDALGFTTETQPRGGRSPGEVEMLWRGLASIPAQRLRALRRMRRSSQTIAAPALEVMRSAAAQADVLAWPTARPPSTRFNDRISGHRGFCFGQLSLATVKTIKDALGVTVNDVVIALCAGALREWLAVRDELPREPLVAMVPVSIRTPAQRGTFGNRVSAMFVPIPTDAADPRRRLERAHEVMRAAKEIHRATPAELLQDLAEFIPPAVSSTAARLAFRLVDRRRPAVNCVISNVPGPQVPVYCAGATVEAVYPVSVIVDGMGLNITVMSLSGHLNFGIVVDREQVDDPWPLIDSLREALEVYERAAA